MRARDYRRRARQLATVVKQYVPCQFSETGVHPIEVGIAIDKTVMFIHADRVCRSSTGRAAHQLGGAVCVEFLDKLTETLRNGGAYERKYDSSPPEKFMSILQYAGAFEISKREKPAPALTTAERYLTSIVRKRFNDFRDDNRLHVSCGESGGLLSKEKTLRNGTAVLARLEKDGWQLSGKVKKLAVEIGRTGDKCLVCAKYFRKSNNSFRHFEGDKHREAVLERLHLVMLRLQSVERRRPKQ